jgi:hypothetical protein
MRRKPTPLAPKRKLAPINGSKRPPKLGFIVRREKGAWTQWEEGSPPGNGCSSRKQPERLGLVTARVEASGAKGPERGPASTQVET